MSRRSHLNYVQPHTTYVSESGETLAEGGVTIAMPNAIISDGLLLIPLFAVTQMSLSASYHLPAIGATGARSVVSTHDDEITLTGMLVGWERYAWKLLLENLAEASKRGTPLATYTGGKVGGLILVTSMTIRTDMQIQRLQFSASAQKRDAIDVTVSMIHVPKPSMLNKLLDIASVGVGALADWGGN
jgi:phage protein U